MNNEEEKIEGEEEKPLDESHIVYGKRLMVNQQIHFDFKYLCENSKTLVPEPLWPDPDKEPLPPPVIHQIVKRPPNRGERQPITLFSIWTPKDIPEGADPDHKPEL